MAWEINDTKYLYIYMQIKVGGWGKEEVEK